MSVLILRPSSDSDIQANYLNQSGGAGSYVNVDEVTKNEADYNLGDYAYFTGYSYGLFGYPNHTIESGTINKITLKGYYKRVDYGANTGGRCKFAIKIGATIYYGSVIDPTSSTTLQSWEMSVNPANDEAWGSNWDVIDDLIAGDSLYGYSSGLDSSYVKSFQHWAEVDYTEGATNNNAWPMFFMK